MPGIVENLREPFAPALLAEIMDALARRVAETSLRSTATELKMSPTGLKDLLEGAAPYLRTKRKLIVWYAAHLQKSSEVDQVQEAALNILLVKVPTSRQPEAREAVLRLIADFSRPGNVSPTPSASASRTG